MGPLLTRYDDTWQVLIAKVSRAAGQSAQAKSMMAYALRTIRSTLGDNHPEVAAVLNSMSALCIEVASFARLWKHTGPLLSPM